MDISGHLERLKSDQLVPHPNSNPKDSSKELSKEGVKQFIYLIVSLCSPSSSSMINLGGELKMY